MRLCLKNMRLLLVLGTLCTTSHCQAQVKCQALTEVNKSDDDVDNDDVCLWYRLQSAAQMCVLEASYSEHVTMTRRLLLPVHSMSPSPRMTVHNVTWRPLCYRSLQYFLMSCECFPRLTLLLFMACVYVHVSSTKLPCHGSLRSD